MQRPLFHIALFLIGGQAVAALIHPPVWPLFVALAVALGAGAFFAWRKPDPARPLGPQGVLVLAAFALLGAIGQGRIDRADEAAARVVERLKRGKWVELTGTADGAVEERPTASVVLLRDVTAVEDSRTTPLPGLVHLSLSDTARASLSARPLLSGQRVRVVGRLRGPEPSRNPADFDSEAYSRSQGICAWLAVSAASGIRDVQEPANGPSLLDRVRRGAKSFRRYSNEMFELYAGAEGALWLRSLFFGEAAALDSRDREAMARAGLAHVFSVSGLHAALIGLLVFGWLRVFGASHRLAWILTALLLWGFAGLVGFRAPVVRTALMTTVFAAGRALGRETDSLNTLSFAAVAMMLLDPRAFWKIDFQLSFLCVFSTVVLGPALRSILTIDIEPLAPEKRRWAFLFNNFIGLPLTLTLATQVGLVPFFARYFRQISLIAPLANMAILPIGSLGLIFGAMLFALGPLVKAAGALLGWLSWTLLASFRGLVEWAGAQTFASVSTEPLPWWAVAAYYAILLSGCYIRPFEAPGQREKARARLMIHLAALVALILGLSLWNSPRGEMRVRFFDVGQGDAAYVEFPSGQSLLIDGGTGFPADKGERVIVPYLKKFGRARLSAIVATHADGDHVGGLASVLRAIPCSLVLHGPSESESGSYKNLLAAVQETGARWEEVWRGDRIGGVPGAELRFLSPGRNVPADWKSNDLSLVLRLDYGETSVLFTGDAEGKAEAAMLAGGEPLAADFLKVGHHGSRFSSGEAFLGAVLPQAIFISCGANNRYGHPAPETLQRLQRIGAEVFRTDREGSLAISTNGDWARIEAQLAGVGAK